MQVDIIFTRDIDVDLKSRLIMLWQKTDYSHCAILYKNHNGAEMLFHCTGRGVHTADPSEYLSTHTIVARKTIRLNCHPERFYGFIEGSEGKEYSKSQLVLIGLKIRNFTNDKAALVCSELVGQVLNLYSDFTLWGKSDFWTPLYIWQTIEPERIAA